MGGQREQLLTTSNLTGGIRLHENDGEVHLHDDKRGIKVAIANYIFWSSWEQTVITGDRQIILSDIENRSIAIIDTKIKISKTGAKIDTKIRLEKAEFGDNFCSIQRFVTNRDKFSEA